MIWMPSLDGRAIDLLEPDEADVDFGEIARTLARLPRFAGASENPVSVALHTLVAIEASPAAARPWVALHDAHEARFGDFVAPAKAALEALAVGSGGIVAGFHVRDAFAELARRHDRVIHAAAGLPLPDVATRAAVHAADLVALVTERRAYLGPSPRPWSEAIEAAEPLPRCETIERWGLAHPDVVAEALFAAFRDLFPALKPERA